MLDPLTALGLASNVVQLVDFTARVFKKTSKKGRHKDVLDHARLTSIASDFRALSDNLKNSLSVGETSTEPTDNEKVLLCQDFRAF